MTIVTRARDFEAPVPLAQAAKPAAPDLTYQTKHSRYGYGCDVRATYAHLPCQPVWTWLTGKALPKGPPRSPAETLLTEPQLWCQIAWSWSIVIVCVALASVVYNSDSTQLPLKLPVFVLCWLLVVNRTRGLLHTFHYTNHGASIANMARARWMAKYFMSVPILHTAWDNYHSIHAKDHHSWKNLCTDKDPDQQFMTQHGFRSGMSETEYWLRVVFAPFFPINIWKHFKFRLEQNFIVTSWQEVVPRVIFWVTLFAAAVALNLLPELALFYLLPLFIFTQHSSWIQHVTEHLWFHQRPADVSPFVWSGSLTWGRFFGRPHPGRGHGLRHAARLLRWWLLVLFADLPVRLYSFMQDLSSHDFHHRSPRVNFWSITRERAAHEGRPSKFGPMTETWSVRESLLVLRDCLCRGEKDPFGLYAWDRAMHAKPAAVPVNSISGRGAECARKPLKR